VLLHVQVIGLQKDDIVFRNRMVLGLLSETLGVAAGLLRSYYYNAPKFFRGRAI